MAQVNDIAWMPGIELGKGYNAGSCIVHNSPFADTEDGFLDTDATRRSETRFELDFIESSSEYLSKLGVSVQASMQIGGFQGEASASYAQEQSINSSSVFMVARVIVHQAIQHVTPTALNALTFPPGVLEQYKTNPNLFLDRYGDYFVSGLVLGGEFVATIEIATNSQSDKREVTAAVKAKSEGGSFSGSASFESAVNSTTKDRRVSVRVTKIGGKFFDGKDLTADDFLHMANGFSREVEDQPVPCRAILTRYDELTTLAKFQTDTRQDVLVEVQRLGGIYTQYSDALADVDYMQFHRQEYLPEPDDAVLKQCRKHLEQERANVRQRAQYVLGQWQSTGEIPAGTGPTFQSVEDLTKGLPLRLNALPKSAAEVAAALRASGVSDPQDGEYTVFLDPDDITSGVKLWCRSMFRSTPTTYLTLPSGAPGANTSIWPASPGGNWRTCNGDRLTTKFDKVRFDPITRTVDLTDTTFANTWNVLTDHNAHGDQIGVYKVAWYGVASASNHLPGEDEQPRTPFGSTNVDLTETGFRIAPGVKWVTDGWDVKTPPGQTGDPTNRRRTIDLQVGGAPGWIRPSSQLQLELDRDS